MPRNERSQREKDDDFEYQKALESEFFLEGLDPYQREWASIPETVARRPDPRPRRRSAGRRK